MVQLTATLLGFALVAFVVQNRDQAPNSSESQREVTVARRDSLTTQPGPAAQFTGSVKVQMLFSAKPPARGSGARVTFEPGARTAWHAHPAGQTLIVTAGTGWVQGWGGLIQEIREGDVVQIPAGQKHWHGATPITAMTHIAIQETLNGKVVDWMEHVTDEQYRK